MAMAVSLDDSVALSVSADHLVGRYDLDVCRSPPLLVHLLNLCTGEPGFGRLRRDGAQNEAPRKRCGRNTRRGACVRHRGLGRPVSQLTSSLSFFHSFIVLQHKPGDRISSIHHSPKKNWEKL